MEEFVRIAGGPDDLWLIGLAYFSFIPFIVIFLFIFIADQRRNAKEDIHHTENNFHW